MGNYMRKPELPFHGDSLPWPHRILLIWVLTQPDASDLISKRVDFHRLNRYNDNIFLNIISACLQSSLNHMQLNLERICVIFELFCFVVCTMTVKVTVWPLFTDRKLLQTLIPTIIWFADQMTVSRPTGVVSVRLVTALNWLRVERLD